MGKNDPLLKIGYLVIHSLTIIVVVFATEGKGPQGTVLMVVAKDVLCFCTVYCCVVVAKDVLLYAESEITLTLIPLPTPNSLFP